MFSGCGKHGTRRGEILAPVAVRKQPEVFWLTFIMRRSRSARLFVKGTLGLIGKRKTSALQAPLSSWWQACSQLPRRGRASGTRSGSPGGSCCSQPQARSGRRCSSRCSLYRHAWLSPSPRPGKSPMLIGVSPLVDSVRFGGNVPAANEPLFRGVQAGVMAKICWRVPADMTLRDRKAGILRPFAVVAAQGQL